MLTHNINVDADMIQADAVVSQALIDVHMFVTGILDLQSTAVNVIMAVSQNARTSSRPLNIRFWVAACLAENVNAFTLTECQRSSGHQAIVASINIGNGLGFHVQIDIFGSIVRQKIARVTTRIISPDIFYPDRMILLADMHPWITSYHDAVLGDQCCIVIPENHVAR